MAGEITIPFLLYPHPVSDPYGGIRRIPTTTGLMRPRGWELPTATPVNYQGQLAVPIPVFIASTPNAYLHVDWATGSTDTTSTIVIKVYLSSQPPDTGTIDPASWDLSFNITQPSAGQWKLNRDTYSLSGLTIASGRQIWARFRRDKPGTSGDTLNATAYLLQAYLVADAS